MNIEKRHSAHSIHSINLKWDVQFMKMYWLLSAALHMCMTVPAVVRLKGDVPLLLFMHVSEH